MLLSLSAVLLLRVIYYRYILTILRVVYQFYSELLRIAVESRNILLALRMRLSVSTHSQLYL
jgi:hypothetical protein